MLLRITRVGEVRIRIHTVRNILIGKIAIGVRSVHLVGNVLIVLSLKSVHGDIAHGFCGGRFSVIPLRCKSAATHPARCYGGRVDAGVRYVFELIGDFSLLRRDVLLQPRIVPDIRARCGLLEIGKGRVIAVGKVVRLLRLKTACRVGKAVQVCSLSNRAVRKILELAGVLHRRVL